MHLVGVCGVYVVTISKVLATFKQVTRIVDCSHHAVFSIPRIYLPSNWKFGPFDQHPPPISFTSTPGSHHFIHCFLDDYSFHLEKHKNEKEANA